MLFDALFVVFVEVSTDNDKNIDGILRTDGVIILIIIFLHNIVTDFILFMYFTLGQEEACDFSAGKAQPVLFLLT